MTSLDANTLSKQKMFSIGCLPSEDQDAGASKHVIRSPKKKPATKRRKQLAREVSLPHVEQIDIIEPPAATTNASVVKEENACETIVLEPGLVLMRNFFSDERCQEIYHQALNWAEKEGEEGFYSTTPDGKRVPNTGEKGRGRIYDNINRFDPGFKQDCERAVDAAVAVDPGMPSMDCTHVLINMYTNADGLVWHRDMYENDGQKDHPIVLQAVGASCRFGFKHNDGDPIQEVIIRSGDALLFGGKCRMVDHAIMEVMLDDCPDWMKDFPCRLSFTYRDSPHIIGREHEFKYFKVYEHLTDQDKFDPNNPNARLGAKHTQRALAPAKEIVLNSLRNRFTDTK